MIPNSLEDERISSPQWLATGQGIIFLWSGRIYNIQPDGTNRHLFLQSDKDMINFTLLPARSAIAFKATKEFDCISLLLTDTGTCASQLYLIQIDGSHERLLYSEDGVQIIALAS